MMLSANVTDLQGNIFGRTICPVSFVVIVLIFLELRRAPGSRRPKKPDLNSRVKVKLMFVYFRGTKGIKESEETMEIR